MFEPGDVILVKAQYTDTSEFKLRPALILFKEMNNIILAGITSNLSMKGITLTKDEGAIKDSIIKLNYIFTVSSHLISKRLFNLSLEKKKQVFDELIKRLEVLNN